MRAAFLLCVLACLAASAAQGAETKPAPTRIAVLHLEDAISKSQFYMTRIEALKKERADAQAQLKSMEEQLQLLDNGLQGLSPNNERYAKMNEDFQVLKLKFKITGERAKSEIDRHHTTLLKQTVDALRPLFKDYCQDNGIVFMALAPNTELVTGSIQDLQLQLGLQSALYFDPSLDVTESFIAFANRRFAAEVPAGPVAPPVPAATPATAPAGQPAGK